jgi:hypothetical protein
VTAAGNPYVPINGVPAISDMMAAFNFTSNPTTKK